MNRTTITTGTRPMASRGADLVSFEIAVVSTSVIQANGTEHWARLTRATTARLSSSLIAVSAHFN